MCIAIVCFPGCDVMNFEINLIFLIKPFSALPKSQDKNLNILRKKISIIIFIIYKEHSVA